MSRHKSHRLHRDRRPRLTPDDAEQVAKFAAFLEDPDPDRRAAYLRHYPEDADSEC